MTMPEPPEVKSAMTHSEELREDIAEIRRLLQSLVELEEQKLSDLLM